MKNFADTYNLSLFRYGGGICRSSIDRNARLSEYKRSGEAVQTNSLDTKGQPTELFTVRIGSASNGMKMFPITAHLSITPTKRFTRQREAAETALYLHPAVVSLTKGTDEKINPPIAIFAFVV